MSARWPWAVVAGAAAVAFLGGLASSIGPAVAHPAATRATPVATSTVGLGPLPALAQPQQASDRPPIATGDLLVRSSFRALQPTVLASMYVARDTHGRICLVEVGVDDEYAATCGADPHGLAAPLLLTYTVLPTGGDGPVTALARLDPDG